MNRQIELVEKKELRESLIGRLEVLDQVGTLLLLPNSEFATTEQVARYYGVGIKTLESAMRDHREELESNGMKKYKKDEILRNILKEGIVKSERTRAIVTIGNEEVIINNTGLILFSKRAILNVGMLLRDSKIAIELRSKLLDIVHDASEGQGSVDTIIDEINEEKRLSLELSNAIIDGDLGKVIEITTKINALKNKRIQEMQPKADYHDNVLNSSKLLTTTEIAKDLGISAIKLNKILSNEGVQFKQNGVWMLYSKHQDKVPEFCKYKITEYSQSLKWTEKGRQWIIDVVKGQAS